MRKKERRILNSGNEEKRERERERAKFDPERIAWSDTEEEEEEEEEEESVLLFPCKLQWNPIRQVSPFDVPFSKPKSSQLVIPAPFSFSAVAWFNVVGGFFFSFVGRSNFAATSFPTPFFIHRKWIRTFKNVQIDVFAYFVSRAEWKMRIYLW